MSLPHVWHVHPKRDFGVRNRLPIGRKNDTLYGGGLLQGDLLLYVRLRPLLGGEDPNGGFVWTQAQGRIIVDEYGGAWPKAISADHSVIVGSEFDHGNLVSRRWENGVETEPCPNVESGSFAVSADGSIVVGVNGYLLLGIGADHAVTQGNGFRWTAGA